MLLRHVRAAPSSPASAQSAGVMEQGLVWRLSSGAPRPAETGRPMGWQGEGTPPGPGRERVQQRYVAPLLPEETSAWRDASQNWEC